MQLGSTEVDLSDVFACHHEQVSAPLYSRVSLKSVLQFPRQQFLHWHASRGQLADACVSQHVFDAFARSEHSDDTLSMQVDKFALHVQVLHQRSSNICPAACKRIAVLHAHAAHEV